ncbi:MAG: dihydrofolate reductase [Bacteroidales bacterium]|nr:dihydrofolate reductase [Bacteroidales bacterium]
MIDINKKPNLSIIVAIAQNGAIGKDNDLLWHLGGDLKRFKKLTTGHPVVMGRKTWESLPKRPLPGRQNIVMTMNPDFTAEGATVVHSINDLFRTLKGCDKEVFVMGGAAIYRALLPFTHRLYITRVYRDFEADVYFPVIDMSEFTLVKLSEPMLDEESGLDYAYEEYDRKFRI